MAKTKATEKKKTTAASVATSAVTAAAKAVAAKKEDVKPAPQKAEVKKPVAQKADKKTEEKSAAPKKRAVRKSAKKPSEKVQEVFIEYNGEQYQTEQIISQIHEVYRSEGHRVGAIRSLRVYIDPVERKAYYVINDKAEGKFVEF